MTRTSIVHSGLQPKMRKRPQLTRLLVYLKQINFLKLQKASLSESGAKDVRYQKIDRRTLCSACRFPNDCTLGKIASSRKKKLIHYISWLIKWDFQILITILLWNQRFRSKTDKSVVKKQKTNGEKESKTNKSPLFWIKDRNIDLPE